MEDTLREVMAMSLVQLSHVLILVLMEDTLRDGRKWLSTLYYFLVLILVLMEDTLRA